MSDRALQLRPEEFQLHSDCGADRVCYMMRAIWLGLILTSTAARASQLPSSLRFLPGPVNGLLISDKVLVYGDARDRVKAVKFVLFTEARRDLVWAGTPFVARGASAIVPERERALFENPAAFWAAYETGRFHDYSQVNTKVLREPVQVSRAVHGGEVLDLDGVRVEVMDTPGHARGAAPTGWRPAGNASRVPGT